MKNNSSRNTSFFSAFLAFISMLVFLNTGSAKAAEGSAIEGRWDITLTMDGKEFPSWLEVTHSGFKTLVGRFVYLNGSARPVSKINFDGKKFSFNIPPQWENETKDLEFEGEMTPKGIAGTMVFVDMFSLDWILTLKILVLHI